MKWYATQSYDVNPNRISDYLYASVNYVTHSECYFIREISFNIYVLYLSASSKLIILNYTR